MRRTGLVEERLLTLGYGGEIAVREAIVYMSQRRLAWPAIWAASRRPVLVKVRNLGRRS